MTSTPWALSARSTASGPDFMIPAVIIVPSMGVPAAGFVRLHRYSAAPGWSTLIAYKINQITDKTFRKLRRIGNSRLNYLHVSSVRQFLVPEPGHLAFGVLMRGENGAFRRR